MKVPATDRARSQAGADRALHEIYARGDRVMTWLVSLHLGLSVLFAFAYQTWFVTALVAPLGAALFFGVRWLCPGATVTRMAAGIALQVFVALHIYQYHGLAEQHFWFFTSTTAMIVYQDPRAMWPGVLLIIAQHVLFALLHNSGLELYFFEQSYVGPTKLALHFGIALIQVGVASTIAYGLRRRTLREHELREELEAARAKAERTTAARTLFLANMSHEIRTPMNGILGMSEVLLGTQLDADQRECVDTIRVSAQALQSVVGDVLDFSKLEGEVLELEDLPFEPAALARDVLRLLATRAQSERVELRLTVAEDTPSWVRGDPGRLRQVLINLVGNAVKFAPGGRVELRLGQGPVEGGSPRTEFVVADNGIGIPLEAQQRIFRPFEQADATTTRRFGGTGLGLSIAQRLVTAMGGTIELQSAPGAGSTFTVALPLPRVESPLPFCAPRRRLRVLVVEDQPINRRVAQRLLATLDCDVELAEDGAVGLERLEQVSFDLVLMDCQMPVLDGYQATARWRERERERSAPAVPIVALTASALVGERGRCLAAGMDDCLTKPTTLAQLRAVVDSVRQGTLRRGAAGAVARS
jgi:signal transduction histidine kinase/ActR/RegA family two-component response regulator